MPRRERRPAARPGGARGSARIARYAWGGSAAFAIDAPIDVLGVDEPTSTRAIRERPPSDLAPDTTTAERFGRRRARDPSSATSARSSSSRSVIARATSSSCSRRRACRRIGSPSSTRSTSATSSSAPRGTSARREQGELSIFAERWAMLTKALRPLPEKWHGLQDPRSPTATPVPPSHRRRHAPAMRRWLGPRR